MIRTLRLSLPSKPTEIRNALDQHKSWIDSCLVCDTSETVHLRFDYPLASIASHRVFGPSCRTVINPEARQLLEQRLQHIEFPPGMAPAAAVRMRSTPGSSSGWYAEWLDCPVALYFSGFSGPVIAVDVPYVVGAGQNSEWREVTLARQEDAPALLGLMKAAFGGNRSLKVMGGESVNIQPLRWDDLVLDDSVARLVRDDFHLFLEREEWYKQHHLPFRRGYLFHGPPGNGKSSVIRAMLSTPGISGFTLNPFSIFMDNDVLSTMFREAAQSTPAMIVLEDLGRCFSADQEKEPECRISLQQLLNHLDGVGNQDGIIVVATANKPSILDAAILRRPGRFDRVVGFQNPTAELRQKYLRQMYAPAAEEDLAEFIRKTAGFSFAQLRETYILAGQIAFETGEQINAEGLVQAACMLSETMLLADRKWNAQVGFREPA